jgi:hypothetical protein
MCVYVNVYLYICVGIYIYIYACVYVCARARAYVHIYICVCVSLINSSGSVKSLIWMESASEFLELVEVIDPLVQNPLGAFQNRTTAVEGFFQSEPFSVQIVPERQSPLSRGDQKFPVG